MKCRCRVSGNFDFVLVVIPLGPIPLDISINGNFSAAVDLAFGYDSYGIRKMIEDGISGDLTVADGFAYAFDGFYVSDFTLPQFNADGIVPGTGGEEKPELSLSAGVGIQAAVNLGIVRGGLEGGVEFYTDIDLQDIAKPKLTKDETGYVTDIEWKSDGKIRFSEMVTMWNYTGNDAPGGLANLFNVEAADFVASAFVMHTF